MRTIKGIVDKYFPGYDACEINGFPENSAITFVDIKDLEKYLSLHKHDKIIYYTENCRHKYCIYLHLVGKYSIFLLFDQCCYYQCC